MPLLIAASILTMQLMAAPASAAASVPSPAKVADDWSAAPPPSRAAIAKAVRDTIAEDKAKQAAVPRRHELDSLRGDKYDTFAEQFDDAAVPSCLGPNALKRQPPRIGFLGVGGLLALPFVVLAKVRGKCK